MSNNFFTDLCGRTEGLTYKVLEGLFVVLFRILCFQRIHNRLYYVGVDVEVLTLNGGGKTLPLAMVER